MENKVSYLEAKCSSKNKAESRKMGWLNFIYIESKRESRSYFGSFVNYQDLNSNIMANKQIPQEKKYWRQSCQFSSIIRPGIDYPHFKIILKYFHIFFRFLVPYSRMSGEIS